MSDRPAGQPMPAFAFRAQPRDAWFLVLAAFIVLLDQLTKWLIRTSIDRGDSVDVVDGVLRLVHVTNSGAAFGTFQGAAPLLAITSLVGMLAIVIYLFNPGFAHPMVRTGLALMLGGAVGNLIDRVAEGRVVDFIKFPHYPAFNVADSGVTVGVLILIVAFLWNGDRPATSES